MQRRKFSLGLLAGFAGAAGLSSFASAQEENKIKLEEGVNYWSVKPRLSNDAPAGKIQVLEFFAYSCSHCYTFESIFSDWTQKTSKDLIEIVRVPVSFRPVAEPHARLYYTLQALNRLDLHITVFDSVFKEKKYLLKPEELKEFFAQHQIDADEALKIYESFGIQAKVQRANQLVNAYGIEGTPSVGVAGMYFATGGSKQTLDIVDELIIMAKQELKI